MTEFKKGKELVKNGPVRSQENSVRTKLKKGKSYIIVCSPLDKGTVGEYFLSLYVSCELHDVKIQRVGKMERCK